MLWGVMRARSICVPQFGQHGLMTGPGDDLAMKSGMDLLDMSGAARENLSSIGRSDLFATCL